MLKRKHAPPAHSRTHTQTHCSHLCVCDRGCQELLLSCAALLAGESVSWAKHTQTHTVTQTDIRKYLFKKTPHTYIMATPHTDPAPENKSVASCLLEVSLKQTKAQFSLSLQHATALSLYAPFSCACLCACVCFRWQWVHLIPNAPVSLLSRTRSDQSFSDKIIT